MLKLLLEKYFCKKNRRQSPRSKSSWMCMLARFRGNFRGPESLSHQTIATSSSRIILYCRFDAGSGRTASGKLMPPVLTVNLDRSYGSSTTPLRSYLISHLELSFQET